MAKRQMEQEVKDIKKKYDQVCDNVNENANTKLNDLKKENDKDNTISQEQLQKLETELKAFMAITEKQELEHSAKIQEICEQVEDTRKRFENLSATGRSVIETANDWIALHSIPDIRSAVKPLSAEMKNTFPELKTLSQIQVRAEINFDDETSLDFAHLKLNMRHTDCIASSGDGTIVITGGVSKNYQSHLTVCNMKGQVLRKETFRSSAYSSDCYCAFLSDFRFATVCWHNEISLYDIRSGDAVDRKKISDVISSWPKDRLVSCIAVDSARRQILVGQFNSTSLHVFDDQLNYHHTLSIPEKIKYPIDLCVIEGNLIICDKFNKTAYLITMERLECKLLHEFTKPVLDGNDCRPISVCESKKGVFFILWATGTDFTCGRRALVQYSQDGSELSTTMEVVNNARCITILPVDQTEKLLVATYDSGKLFSYSVK